MIYSIPGVDKLTKLCRACCQVLSFAKCDSLFWGQWGEWSQERELTIFSTQLSPLFLVSSLRSLAPGEERVTRTGADRATHTGLPLLRAAPLFWLPPPVPNAQLPFCQSSVREGT